MNKLCEIKDLTEGVTSDFHHRFAEFRQRDEGYLISIPLLQRYLMLASSPSIKVVQTILNHLDAAELAALTSTTTILQVAISNHRCPNEILKLLCALAPRTKVLTSRTLVSVMMRENRPELLPTLLEKLDLTQLQTQEMSWLQSSLHILGH